MGKEILIAVVTSVVVFALVANVSALGSLTGYTTSGYVA
jgi:hypothetical protein